MEATTRKKLSTVWYTTRQEEGGGYAAPRANRIGQRWLKVGIESIGSPQSSQRVDELFHVGRERDPDKLWKQPFFAFQLTEVCAPVCVSLVCTRSIKAFLFILCLPQNLHQRRLLLILSLSLSSLFVSFVSTADCSPYRSPCVARRIEHIQWGRVPAASPLKTCWTAIFVRGNAAWSDFAKPCRSPAFLRDRSSAGSSSYRLSPRAGRIPWTRFLGLLTMPTRCPSLTPNLQVSSTTHHCPVSKYLKRPVQRRLQVFPGD